MASARVRMSIRAAAMTAFAGAALLVLPLTTASATPSQSDVAAQLDQQWNQLEPTIEQYNAVHSQLLANQAKSQSLQAQLAPLQSRVDSAQQTVGDIAAGAYMGGSHANLNAILSGSPGSLAERLTMLDMLAVTQRDQIKGVTTARDKYVRDKRSLDALIAQQSQQDAQLAAKKQQIQGQIAKLQQMQQAAGGGGYGGGGGSSSSALKLGPCPSGGSGAGLVAAKKACSLIGRPYVWAGAGPGYDCSGLVMVAWQAAGVSLPHNALAQKGNSFTNFHSIAQLQVGDLLFFYPDTHHVGIYVGAGMMVHAPHSNDYVRMAPLSGYWLGNLKAFKMP